MKRLLRARRLPLGSRADARRRSKPFLIEEAYEVLEAIDDDDAPEHCEELGDLLVPDRVPGGAARPPRASSASTTWSRAIHAKMVRRHPHVFGDAKVTDGDEVLANWGKLKAVEHAEKGKKRRALDGVPRESAGALAGAAASARRRRRSASTGPTSPACATRSPRSCARSTRRSRGGNRPRSSTRWAISCSRSAGCRPSWAWRRRTRLRAALRAFTSRFEAVEDRVLGGR